MKPTNCENTAEAIEHVRNVFNFSVDKFPLSGPEGMTTPHYGLFRSDSMECVGNACKRRYVPHQTDDVVALVEAAGEAFDGKLRVMCNFREGHYVSIAPTDEYEYRRAIFGSNDNVFPRLIVHAGYDGKAFKASMGFYRDACRNLAMLQTVKAAHARIKHTSGLREKMDDLIATFSRLRQSWQRVGDQIDEMQNREVSAVEFLNAVYGEPETHASRRSVSIHRNRTRAIFTRLQRERVSTGREPMGQEFRVSAWEAFNAVQGYVQHEATRRGNPTPFDRALFALNDKTVQKAELIACGG